MYHYISESPSVNDRIRYGLSVSPAAFDAQLKLLSDNGYTTVSLRDVYEYLAVGKELPAKPLVLTFDDGYLDNYTNAFPLLQKYGMVGTFFVLTGPADVANPAYMSWEMIMEMSRAGMDIQLHARDHFDMRGRSYEWLVFQIYGGRQSIEGHTGQPVIFVAYPSGKYDAGVLRFLNQTHFWAAVTTEAGHVHTLTNPLLWTRVRISGQLRLKDFANLLGLNLVSVNSQKEPLPTPTPTFSLADRVDVTTTEPITLSSTFPARSSTPTFRAPTP